jgi:hypothetical protein
MIEVPVSWGELVDKITILEIKNVRIGDPAKRANVARELALLGERLKTAPVSDALSGLTAALKRVNEALWDIEDEIRDQERAGTFGERFIELARAVYRTNDRRSQLKREIDAALGSTIVEEKSYQPY